MDKIEKIRQEIERLKEPHERNLKKPMERGRIGYAHGYVDCCDEILDFIDPLPGKKPNVWDIVDINKAIKARVKKTGEIIAGFYDGNGHFDHYIDHDIFDRYSIDEVEIPYEEFIAGLNPPPKIPQMKTDKDLEEASEKYEQEHTIQRYDGGGFTPDSNVGIGEAFIAGAKWMAGQGVTKEAVIGMATKDIEINVSQRTLDALGLCPGDKVIVQIRRR